MALKLTVLFRYLSIQGYYFGGLKLLKFSVTDIEMEFYFDLK